MAENNETEKTETTTPAPSAAKKVFCFVSKHDVDEKDAVEVPYVGGQKVWVAKQFIKYQ